MPPSRLKGVLSPVATPFQSDLSADPERFVRHCKWLLAHGCSGLAVFGTNSEANSLAAEERIALLEALVGGGVPAEKLLAGTGCCALPDSVKLTAHAVKLGCAGVLMLPPFYYKGVPDEGVYRNFSEVIQRVGDDRLRLYLYHIPPVSQVPITLGLIERLLSAYPREVVGIKDSSGVWNHTQAVLDAFADSGFDVFVGSEVFLLQNLRAGGVGCITAGANVNPHGIDAVYRSWQSAEAETLQAKADSVRKVLQSVPMLPALKAVIAHFADDSAWATVRPPLVELSAQDRADVIVALTGLGFEMPGLATASGEHPSGVG
jgi:4-hydroxy-tetrahydrodipicolinate synthase